MRGKGHLRVTWVLARSLAAITGSMEIMSFFLADILTLLASTCAATQSRKGWPITAAHMFTIHAFGVLGMSWSSGMY